LTFSAVGIENRAVPAIKPPSGQFFEMFGYGAVCDVSTLSSCQNFSLVRSSLDGNFFIPSVTYSWLARDKLIQVRKHVVKYTFVSRLVREGEIFAVFLPEVLEEISRRLLFLGEREIPLTDLRTVFLAAHLKLPIVCIGDELSSELSDKIGAELVGRESLDGEQHPLLRSVRRYRDFRMRKALPCSPADPAGSRMTLSFLYVDLSKVLEEYADEHVLPAEVVSDLDGCSFISVLSIALDNETEAS